MNTCKTCRFWKPEDSEEYLRYSPEKRDLVSPPWPVGICQKAEHWIDSYDGKVVGAECDWSGVVDGSDYYAALVTAEDFGCVRWEAKEE